MRVPVLVGILVGIVAAACGSPTSPPPLQLGGVWHGTATLTSIAGGECVGAALQTAIGSTNNYTLSITQSGSTLTATSTDLSDGTTCSWAGTAETTSFVLNETRCDAAMLTGLQCSNGAMRDVQETAASINGTVSGTTMNGTEAETYNVFVSGTTNGVGVMAMNARFTATRQ